MKILVTGADGFIGSHLVEALLEHGHDVRAMVQYNSFNHWGWLESIESLADVEVICGDIRDPHFCKMACAGIEQVLNLAALIAIPYSYQAPASYVETNVMGALNICQAALDAGVTRVIQTSTSEVYGTARYVPIDESHPLQPQSPYSASKIGADNIALSFFNAFELPVTVARPFNTFGPRQSARAVIPTIIGQIAAGAQSINLGDTSPTRDFTFVKDTCKGFIELLNATESAGEILNIGSNFEVSIEQTFKTIKKLMNSNVELEQDAARLRPGKSEVFRLWCDNSRIKALCGFEPDYTFENGLQETIDWFLQPDNLSKYKTQLYNV